jgi:hypothetical protein
MKNVILVALAALSFVAPVSAQETENQGLIIFFGDRLLEVSKNRGVDDVGNFYPNSTLPVGLQNVTFNAQCGELFGWEHTGAGSLICDLDGQTTAYSSLYTTAATGGNTCSDTPEGVFAGFGASAARITGIRQNVIDLCQPHSDVLPEQSNPTNPTGGRRGGLWWEVADSFFLPTSEGNRVINILNQSLDGLLASGAFGPNNTMKLNGFVCSVWNDAITGPAPAIITGNPLSNDAVNNTLLAAASLERWALFWAQQNGVTIDTSDWQVLPVRRPRWNAPAYFAGFNLPLDPITEQRWLDNEWFNAATSDQWDLRAQGDPLMLPTIDLHQLLIDEVSTDSYPSKPNAPNLGYTPVLNDRGVWLLGKEISSRIF